MREWASSLRFTVELAASGEGRGRERYGFSRPAGSESGSSSGLSDSRVVAEVHARYRPEGHCCEVRAALERAAVDLGYSSFSEMTLSEPSILLTEPHAQFISEWITRYDQQYEQALTKLPRREFESISTVVVVAWVMPIGLWYVAGFSAQWWRPFLVRRRRTIGAIVLVLGAGLLVAGMMDSDSFAGGLGAMMLVGGFLVWRSEVSF